MIKRKQNVIKSFDASQDNQFSGIFSPKNQSRVNNGISALPEILNSIQLKVHLDDQEINITEQSRNKTQLSRNLNKQARKESGSFSPSTGSR